MIGFSSKRGRVAEGIFARASRARVGDLSHLLRLNQTVTYKLLRTFAVEGLRCPGRGVW